MAFPIDTSAYEPLSLDPNAERLTAEQRRQWETNIGIVRDTILFFTAVSGARGLSGHTGGAWDIVPEVLLVDGFSRGSDRVYPVLFDEAGHRVAIQYAMSAFNGHMPFERLLQYRMEDEDLYGHPEPTPDIGVAFASGRLGHLWALVNGVARAHPDKAVVLFGSDGSQMEGNDAEAARLAVAQELGVKVLVDDNDVTIAGHPSEYLPGFDVARTLAGHGLRVASGDGEDLGGLYARVREALVQPGPAAVVSRRPMAVGLPEIEGEIDGHEVISAGPAAAYLRSRGHDEAAAFLEGVEKHLEPERSYRGSSDETGSNRKTFGAAVSDLLDELPAEERARRVMVIDSDLAGSTGLKTIQQRHPEVFVASGVMERGNLSAAAGFGFEEGRQGVFSTFAAFLEMVVSEITMARLNRCNLLCHFSHSGIDAIADNTSHFGIHLFHADTGVEEQPPTPLLFPADAGQMVAVLQRVFWEKGLRFVFSTRSEVPWILDEQGERMYDPERGYRFEPGRDEVVREGKDGWVIAYGDLLYRALDAVERARADGLDVGLINKPHLNAVDEETLARVGGSRFALVVENQNRHSGLGARYGSWLLERGYAPAYDHLGVTRLGAGGTWSQVINQGLGPDDILEKLRELAG